MTAPTETPKQCSATCAHGDRCSRGPSPFGRGLCEQHSTQKAKQDRDQEWLDRQARGVPWYIDDTGRP